jgi:putative sugar O-methyltransferase
MAGEDQIVNTSTEAVLDIIRENFALVSRLGLPDLKSEYWTNLLAKGRQDFGGKGDFIHETELWSNFRNNVISKGMDNSNLPVEAREKALAKWNRMYDAIIAQIPKKYHPHVEESPIGNPTTIERDGRKVSGSTIEYAFMLSHIAPFLEKSRVVVEIGGGYGGLARAIKKTYRSLKYVLLDLPEANAIQTYYLKKCFPDGEHLYASDVYEKTRVNPEEQNFDFLVLPGPFIEKLPADSVDLFINTRSMMEMNLETVSFYFEHMHRQLRPGGAFYCINRYEKKTRLKDYPFDENWYLSYSSPWPSTIDQNPHHELVAVRTEHPVVRGAKELLHALPPFENRFWSRLFGRS